MEVQRELSQIIRSEIKDPRIHPLTSVVAVEVTPDLKYCKAYISVLGDEEAGKATMKDCAAQLPSCAGNWLTESIYVTLLKLNLYWISLLNMA